MLSVLLINYHRPIQTKARLDFLRTQPLESLYLFCDGPKNLNQDDFHEVMQVRELIDKFQADYPIYRFYSQANLGCRLGVLESISWFFKSEECGMILEDDVEVNYASLRIMSDLLKYLKDTSEVSSVSVYSHVPQENLSTDSRIKNIRYSNYVNSLAWGTWFDRWNKFESEYSSWHTLNSFSTLCINRGFFSALYWKYIFRLVASNRLDTWDVQWLAFCWSKGLKTAVTVQNFAKHNGWGESATHTVGKSIPIWAKQDLDIKVPEFALGEEIEVDRQADRWIATHFYGETPTSFVRAWLAKFRQVLRAAIKPN